MRRINVNSEMEIEMEVKMVEAITSKRRSGGIRSWNGFRRA